MALKPLNSPGGFSVGEISTGAINVISSTGNVTTGNLIGSAGGNLNIIADNLLINGGNGVGNLRVGNLIATGNVQGAYILGNGSQLTGMYSNLNVANFLPTYTGSFQNLTGNVTTTANIQGQYILGNGYFLSSINAGNIVGSYGNGDVANYLASNANVTILTTGNITTAANVSGSYLLGNIRSATGGYDDANVAAYTGALTNLTGNVTTTANVQGAYILGNGYFLSNINASNIVGSYGNSDVANYLASGALTSNVTTTGNIAGGYLLGNGYFITGIQYSNIAGANAGVKAYLESGSMINANFDGGTLYVTGIANLGPTTVNGNLVVAGNISATGNLTYINVQDLVIDDPLIQLAANNPGDVEDLGLVAGYYNGANLHTGFARDYTDKTWKVFENVASNPNTVIAWSQAVYAPFKAGPILSNASITANANVTATGNVSGTYLLGNGYFITNINAANIVGAYSNADVANYLPTYTGALPNLTGNVTTTANVQGGYLLGNGYFITGIQYSNIAGAYGNSNVAAYLPTYTGNLASLTGNVTTTANISASYLLGNGAFITGLPAGYSNADVANYLASNAAVTILTTGNITTSGNISAGNFIGTGANTTIAAGSFSWTFDNVGNLTFPGTGNLVGGNLISANFFSGNGSLLTGMYSNLNVANYLPTYTGAINSLTGNVTTTANVQGAFLLGNGAFITGLPAGYSNADVANYLASGSLTSNIITTGNISGGNLSGTLTTAAQPNITSVGTLTSLNVTGNVTSSGNVSGNYLLGNGYFITGLPAGYSNADVASYLASNAAVTILTTGDITTSGNVTANNFTGTGSNTTIRSNGFSWVFDGTGNLTTPVIGTITGGNLITANFFSGDGSLLTNINAGNITGAYGNANVKSYLESGATINANFGTGTVTTSGNINGGNLVSSANIDGTNVNATKLASSGALTINSGSNGNIVIQPNGSGNVVLSNTFINSVAYPVQDQDAASKVYVDNLVSTAISYHDSVIAATTTDLATATGGTITYNQPNGGSNGVGATLSTTGSFNLIDSANIQSANARILVKNEANGAHNGIYVWSNATAITRADNEDTAGVGTAFALGLNDYFFVTGGNVNLGTAWIVDAPNSAIVFGTSSIQFAQFSQSQVYSANTSAGLVLVGQQFNAKTDNNTTAFDGGGNIIVKAGANLTTPNIGNATGSSLNVTGTLTGGTITSTGNITGGNLITAGTVFAPAIVANSGINDTRIELGSATGIIAVTTNGNSTQFGPSGTISLSGASQINGGTFGGSGLTLGTSQTDLFQNRGGNVTVQVGTGGTIANTWTFAQGGAFLAPGNITSSGNVSGTYLLGNGAFITGLPAGYSNADVANYLNSGPNINILLGNSNSNITTGGTIRTYGTSIANNFVANSTVTIQSSATQAVVFDAINQTTSSATLTTLATINVTTLPADSSALEVTLRGKDGTNTQAGKIMIVWGGSDMDYSRYAEVLAGAGCGVPSASFDGTNLLIQVTPLNSNSMSWNGSITSV